MASPWHFLRLYGRFGDCDLLHNCDEWLIMDFGKFDFIENSTTRGVVKIRVLWYQGIIERL